MEKWWRSWLDGGPESQVLDDDQQRDVEEKRRELEQRLVMAVHDLGVTEHGREFLRWTLAQCGVFQQTFPQNRTLEAFVAGRREFGLKVLALCAKDDITAAVLADLREVELDV